MLKEIKKKIEKEKLYTGEMSETFLTIVDRLIEDGYELEEAVEQAEQADILDIYIDKSETIIELITTNDDDYLTAIIAMLEFGLDIDEAIELADEYKFYDMYNPISSIYDDAEDAGREYIDSCYDIEDFVKWYIDYEKLGEDLDEPYVQLSSGRVVYLNM